MNNIGTADNEKLLDLYNRLKEGSLILRPSFQRNLVWNNSHKENFIDTILRGLPFPEIYLSDGEIDLDNQTSIRLVVDGQQRLDTIFSYINNNFKVRNITPFNELSAAEKTNFFDYKIVVRDLGRLDDDQIIDIFKRINSVRYALNAMEINNALYEGAFISTAKEIQESNLFDQISMFSENQYARMRDIEYILLIMSTIEEGGYFGASSEIEKYIQKYDDDYPNAEEIKSDILQSVDNVKNADLEPDSIWFRKSSFFSLIIELIKAKNKGKMFESDELKDMLTDLEENILANKSGDSKENEYARFYSYIFQGTNGRAGRIARGTLIENEITNRKENP